MTTCQICGRLIKASRGIIAHHGYQRPDRGSGWQTASCFGARYRPYEVACDAIPIALKSLAAHIEQREKFRKELTTKPPETLEQVTRRDAYRRPLKTETYTRPEGFKAADVETYFSDFRSYVGEFKNRLNEVSRQIDQGKRDHKALAKRLADWKA